MKHKNVKERLEARRKAYDETPTIQRAANHMQHRPGSFKK